MAPAPTVPSKSSRSAAVKSPPSSLPVPEIALVNVPPVMAPLQVTSTVTALFPALKEAPESMTILLTASRAMVSGSSASGLFKSTVPVMVSTPFSSLKPLNTPPVTEPPRSFTVASVKSPPVMESWLFTVPVNVPPEMVASKMAPPLLTSPLISPPVMVPSLLKDPPISTVTSQDNVPVKLLYNTPPALTVTLPVRVPKFSKRPPSRVM